MAVTLKDVAEACGVSYSTVSKALKNSQLVKPKTKEMIQQKAVEMNYIPNHSARALVSKKSGTIGLIWPSVDRVAVTHLITEINLAIKSLGYVMFVSIDDVAAASKKFVEFGCDGIVIFDEGDDSNLPPEIYNNVPVVAYGVDRNIPYPIVNVNHAEAMILAIKGLLAKGIDTIDYIGDINTTDARQIAKKEAIINYCENNNVTYRIIDSNGLNALITLAEFGHKTEMLTVLPQHALSHIALQKMYQTRVGTEFVKQQQGRIGTYYMEESFGYRSGKVIYDREHSTFAEHGNTVVDDLATQSGDYFIFTGITLAVNKTIREQIASVLTKLKQQGTKIVFDINFRSNLWTKAEALPVIQSVLPLVDVLFFGKKDATHLLETNDEHDDIETCAKTIQKQFDIHLMASSNRNIEQSTLQGITLAGEKFINGKAYPYTVLNRIGAGDAFMAGFLHGLVKGWQLDAVTDFATKCSVIQHTTNEDALNIEENAVHNLSSHFGELKR